MEALWGVLIVVLLVGMVWGLVQTKRRNRANDPVTAASTKALYADPAHYDEKRPGFEEQLEPSDKP